MKKNFTVTIDINIIERLRNAAYWNRVPVNRLAESYLDEGLLHDEDEHGGPFERRPEKPIFK